MKRIKILLVLFVMIFYSGQAYSQVSMTGGKGLCRVLSADPITPTDIYLSWNISTFMEQTSKTTLSKYYLSNLNLTFGLASYLEMFVNFIPYQDDQKHLWGQIGDTYLGIKYLTPFSSEVFKFGIGGAYKLPTAKMANVPYESFSTGHPAYTLYGLTTLDFVSIMPKFPLKFNFNLGYKDNDIYDQYFQSKIDQMFLGAGFKFSIRTVQFYTEYSGEIFFNNSDYVDFSQNSIRLTQGIRFLGPWSNTIDIAVDIGLTQYDDSLTAIDPVFHKQYFDWKVRATLSHRFSVYKYFDKTAKLERQKREEELRKLEAIRKKREKVKEDLKKMKESLEKDDPSKKKKKSG